MIFLGLDLNCVETICDPASNLLVGGTYDLGKLVFAQITQHLPLTTFRRCVARYVEGYKVKSFSCSDHYLCMAFAQLTYRESLRDIEACLRAQASKLYHMDERCGTAPSSGRDHTYG
jgi:hypothetical protein